ncbi:hypothetical protein GCM10010981_11690 [Dyella nitratireducens]|uniref:DUF3592 domain-containing protein n=2 Tax=Dyella nitratireducens TaxID=1849580 RepID=A0ABQ1FPA7_9GAMM|nr:hypothetical protein GCM10010981_11690 [Dyella nitratireducens]GLQ43769.1 hypothetical protein GCM10007902_36190 [Dyella nitratireducens]
MSWPTTEGEVAHSAILYQTDTSATTDNATTYKADVVYRYKVHGKSYTSSKISFLDLAATTGRAASIVSRYPDNSVVQVYYNPTDPAESVLEPGDASGIQFLYLLGSIFGAAGLFFLIMSLTGHVHVH